jgi:hypothetical protein
VVALNKMDLEDAGALVEELRGEVMAAAQRHQLEQAESDPLPPFAIVPCSAVSGGLRSARRWSVLGHASWAAAGCLGASARRSSVLWVRAGLAAALPWRAGRGWPLRPALRPAGS